MKQNEIKPIVDKIPEDMDIELNVSCPNTDKHMVNDGLKLFLNPKREWCIIKLPPQPDPEMIEKVLRREGYGKEGEIIYVMKVPEPVAPLSEIFNQEKRTIKILNEIKKK